MSLPRSVRVADENFDVTFRGSAWQACEALDAVDGSIEIEARSVQRPERSVVGLVHGHLARTFPGGPFAVPISAGQVSEMIEDALSEWARAEADSPPRNVGQPERHRIDDVRWLMTESPAQTACPRCGGALSSVDRASLQPIAHNLFRCGPGQHPRAFEGRCGGCRRILIVLKEEGGLELASSDQDALLRQIRELDREDVPRGRRDG